MQDSSWNRRRDGLVGEAGLVTAMSRNSIIDQHKTWSGGIWEGCLVRIFGGPNDMTVARVTGNSTRELYIDLNLEPAEALEFEASYEIICVHDTDKRLDALLAAIEETNLHLRRAVLGLSITTDEDLTEADGGELP